MRTPFFVLVLLLALGIAGSAFAQKREIRSFEGGNAPGKMSESELQAARRKAAGIRDVDSFGKSKEPPPKPFPWGAVIMGSLIVGMLAPFGYKMAQSTKEDLQAQATFGSQGGARSSSEVAAPRKQEIATDLASLSRRPASRRAGANRAAAASKEESPAADDGRTPRDRVWDAITSGGNWVTAEWVASTAGMSGAEATDEIAALVAEGYLQERKDSAGRAVFRAVS